MKSLFRSGAIFGIVALFLLALMTKSALASEGIIELRNQTGQAARCGAYSVLMQDQQYTVLLSCRDVTYPGGTDVFSYVVWAVPVSGGNHVRLGEVGFGKASFRTRTDFSALYITQESNSRTRTPSGPVVMQGGVQRIEFLEGPAPTSQPELGEPESTPVPTPQPRNIGRILAAGGILAFIAIFGVILVIFVITRK